MKKTKKLRLRRKGGAIIGSGAYGIVFKPPLACEHPIEHFPNTEEFVGKLTSAETAAREMSMSAKIRGADSEGIIASVPSVSCKIAAAQTNSNWANTAEHASMQHMNTQMISRYGGITLFSIEENLKKLSGLNPSELKKLKLEVLRIIRAISVLLLRYINILKPIGIVHDDIDTKNILYNPTTGIAILIDFDPIYADVLKRKAEEAKEAGGAGAGETESEEKTIDFDILKIYEILLKFVRDDNKSLSEDIKPILEKWYEQGIKIWNQRIRGQLVLHSDIIVSIIQLLFIIDPIINSLTQSPLTGGKRHTKRKRV